MADFLDELKELCERHHVSLQAGYDQELIVSDEAGSSWTDEIRDQRESSERARILEALRVHGPLLTFDLHMKAQSWGNLEDVMAGNGEISSEPAEPNKHGAKQRRYSLKIV